MKQIENYQIISIPSTILPFAFGGLFLFGISATAAAAESEEADAEGAASTANTEATESDAEKRDEDQENNEVDPRLALVIHTVRDVVQAAHVGGDTSSSRDSTENADEVVVISVGNFELLVLVISVRKFELLVLVISSED